MSEEKKDYEGPGRFVNMVGKGVTYSTIAAPVSGALILGGAYKIAKDAAQHTVEAAEHNPGLSKVGMGLAAAGGLVGTGATIVGAVKGWRQSGRAEKQHTDLVDRVSSLESQLSTVKEVAGRSHVEALESRQESGSLNEKAR